MLLINFFSVEIYRFLSSEAGIYLPPAHTVNIWHLRDLCANKRRLIKNNDVRVIALPFYDGISIEEILEFGSAHNHGEAMLALPSVRKEILRLPRAFIGNVMYTIIGEPFAQWVHARINARNQRIQQENDMTIEMNPDIAAIFRASTSASGKQSVL